jgi:cold shock CspA family protein
MRQGYVKFVVNQKGYGIIVPDDGDGTRSSDVFFGLDLLLGRDVIGVQRVEFEAWSDTKGPRASKVVPL